MRTFIGIDLGSTTTKAVILGLDAVVLGRGITNSRSNYEVACQVALGEAFLDAGDELHEERFDTQQPCGPGQHEADRAGRGVAHQGTTPRSLAQRRTSGSVKAAGSTTASAARCGTCRRPSTRRSPAGR